MMKTAFYSLALSVSFLLPAHADLTIVQKVEGVGAATDMTIKIKGDKARIEASPQITTIVDGKTGEVINLINKEKTVVRISPDKVKAVTDMIKKFNVTKEGAEKAKLIPTGHKETVNGYETEQYTYDGPEFKATYWIASNYPDGAAILAQLQSINSDFWNAANTKMPDYRDFPGLPIRTRMVISKQDQADKSNPGSSDHGPEITTTITSVNRNPISDSEFTVPGDFKEIKLPDIFNKKNPAPSDSPSP
jgi:nitrogen regulatory protein PII